MISNLAEKLSLLAAVIVVSLCGCGHDSATLSTDSYSEPEISVVPATAAASKLTAKDILGNSDYPAFCYGGYRKKTRDDVPTVDQLKEDMKILAAMGVKVLRTYNTQQYSHPIRLLDAIEQLRQEDAEFEMYVVLGAWIDCEGAWTANPNHAAENTENNTAEINAAVELANRYPGTVKIIAVGNEAMVHWATSYFVSPGIILKWVNHLQNLKSTGELSPDIWITSSDNFASWGGDTADYHTEDLTALIDAVDFVSLHTYPFHDTHYNSEFWVASPDHEGLSDTAAAEAAVQRAMRHAVAQYQSTADYIRSLGISKPIHIGETGWASMAGSLYGATGSQAADEYKAKLFYDAMREWTNEAGLSCFYFEAFDEQWKDPIDAAGSENHFGLISITCQAKYALWDHVDAGVFEGLTRGGQPITKTFGGDRETLLAGILRIPGIHDSSDSVIATVNDQRSVGEQVTENKYVAIHESMVPDESNDLTYPSERLKLNVWEGTCGMEMSDDGIIHVVTGTGAWWGCGLEIQADRKGENLSQFSTGNLHFDIKGDTRSRFDVGFQTGSYTAGTQVNHSIAFGPEEKHQVSDEWQSLSIPMEELNNGANLADVTAIMFFRGDRGQDGKEIDVRNIYFSRN